MRTLTAASVIFALLAVASGAQASSFCDALDKAAASAAFGFATVRGPVDAAAHTSSFEVYRTKVALTGATACSVSVPHSPGLGPVTYACDFAGGIDVARAMDRLVRRTARCAHVSVGNPPRLKTGPEGPTFGFENDKARFDFSAAKADGKAGLWTVTVSIAKGSHPPRRPAA